MSHGHSHYSHLSKKEHQHGIELKKPYKHYKNGKIYSPTGFGKTQENGKWVWAVKYIEMYVESDEEYFRTVDEFLEKFELDKI